MGTLARPTKPIDVTSGTYTKEQVRQRQENEALLKGDSDNIVPSEYLNEQEKKYFMEVVNHYEASGILSNMDVAVIEQYAVSRHAMDYINEKMRDNPAYKLDKNLMIQREKWEKSLNRSANELGLSPQSRAKLGNLNTEKIKKDQDPLLKALKRAK